MYKILQANGINPNTMPQLEYVFAPSSWEHGDTGLTNWGNFDDYFPNISPREIKLGTRYEMKRKKNGKRRIVECPERFYYVSLLASLELMLSNQKILDMVANPKKEGLDSSLLCDFTDGSILQTHGIFSIEPQSLKIILYYDDLEITNQQTNRKHKFVF